ncbi:type II toxin-antitoxin system VapB family antitoxin [Burkholderia sp. PAMC 28687]|uniref:type II toxin-antitoxin system VapB family antitoxin n=1 Tax=Burkholderia sp. PAMC 28687 TaxID=1795874 RepID=UPI0012D7897F|nr:type II toxin-antitoxin system VapB family antitoxin [Burkholderia sp. PAMC 28687]
MRTTIARDDNLSAKAQAYTGIEEKTALVRKALKALIHCEAAKRLANLGGSQPGIKGRRCAGRMSNDSCRHVGLD